MKINRSICLLGGMLWVVASATHGADPVKTKTAIQKSLSLLQTSAADYIDQKSCFSCHHQTLPVMAMDQAKQHGFKIDPKAIGNQSAYTIEFFSKRIEKMREGKGVPGGPYNAGYALVALGLDRWPADKTVEAMVQYLLKTQKEDGHWPNGSKRPPLEGSLFTSTALGLRGLQLYAESADQTLGDRLVRARKWLETNRAKTTEDLVFQLNGMGWAGSDAKAIQPVYERLRQQQREDGGWAQTSEMKSDAYATGSAMVILNQLKMGAKDPAYRKGVAFLLSTQKEDGSWHVKSRSKPFQKYFESGYPHGKDQFISIAAGSWATMALIRAHPEPKP